MLQGDVRAEALCVTVDRLSADGEKFVMLPSLEGGSIDGNQSDKVLQYSAKSAVISAVRGKILNRTNESTNIVYSDKVKKYCSIVQKVLSLVLFSSKVPHYSLTVLKCFVTMIHGTVMQLHWQLKRETTRNNKRCCLEGKISAIATSADSTLRFGN